MSMQKKQLPLSLGRKCWDMILVPVAMTYSTLLAPTLFHDYLWIIETPSGKPGLRFKWVGGQGLHVVCLCDGVKPVALLWWQVLELQQQLKSAQHQLRVEEARAGESSRLERDSRDLSDTLSALRAKQQEEHITRSHKLRCSSHYPSLSELQVLRQSFSWPSLYPSFPPLLFQEAVGAAWGGAAAAGALPEAEGGLHDQDQCRAQPPCPAVGDPTGHPGGWD